MSKGRDGRQMTVPEHYSIWDYSMSRAVARRGVVCSWRGYPNGYKRPFLHHHRGTEVIYCVRGEGAIYIAKTEYLITPGAILIFPGNLPHCPLVSGNYDRWNLCFMPLHSRPIHSRSESREFQEILYRRLTVDDRRRIERVFQEIDAELKARTSQWEHFVSLLLEQLFILVHRSGSYAYRPSVSQFSREFDLDDVLMEMVDYIESNLASELTIDHLAETFNYTPGHVWRVIRNGTGCSPIQYINARRLERACKLLDGTDASVGMIASKCGFRNSSYLARLFKQTIGCTPREYREQWRAWSR